MNFNKTLTIPNRNGDFFCSHDLDNIPTLLKSNRRLFNSYNITIAGYNYRQYVQKVESEFLNLLSGDNDHSVSRPFIASGHQPVFFHPGIWIKNFFIDKLARENNGSAFDCIIDYDCLSEVACFVISKNEIIERKKEVFVKMENQQPIECCPAPDQEQLRKFHQKIKTCMGSFSYSPIEQCINKFIKKGEKVLSDSKDLAEFMVKTRKGYEEEGGLHYYDIMLSQICGTDPFLLFVLHIVEDIQNFSEVYNQQLEQYRINHKLRYKANPFPDLKKDGNSYEIPFWSIQENRRSPIYVIHEGPYISFYTENNNILKYKKGEFKQAIENVKKNQLKIRPKAIPLTLFLKLFFADIFIHGIGGAKYDEVTDGIIANYFKVEPPCYIAASLTLFPDIPLNEIRKEDIDRLKTIARNIKFKPEIFEDKLEGVNAKIKFKEFATRKMKLLQHSPSRNEKKEYYQQVKSITEELSRFLDNYYLEIKKQLKVLEDKERDNKVLYYREYPYFLYDVNMVKEMIK